MSCYLCHSDNQRRIFNRIFVIEDMRGVKTREQEHSEYCSNCGTLLYGTVKQVEARQDGNR